MCDCEVRTKLAEGKTKIIWTTEKSGEVVVESKDDITAGDGIKREKIENKGIYTTETACNCFRLLTKKGIANHYIQQIDAKNFLAEKMIMIPIEVVIRRIAFGSYLNRYPKIEEGTIFKDLIVEFFLKDDANHDPLMIWDYESKRFFLYDAKKPKNVGISKEYSIEWEPVIQRFLISSCGIFIMIGLGQEVFTILEKAWEKQGVVLADLKVEFGISQSGEVKVADVLSNDEWRIWPEGDKFQMKDKQVFRNLDGRGTLADLEKIRDNYAWVAEQTAKFVC